MSARGKKQVFLLLESGIKNQIFLQKLKSAS